MYQSWRNITFLHWRYPAEVLQAFLPEGLRIDTCEGSAWLRLAPFMLGLRLTKFPETNVLTYVIGPDGASGVWFFSLDAASALAVAGARVAYGLPYLWSRMRVHVDSRRAEYASSRLWPDG